MTGEPTTIRTVEDCTAFLADYHRGWGVEPRLADDDVPDHFPPPLWRVYRDLGGLFDAGEVGRRPLGTQDNLVPPGQVRFDDGLGAFAIENQGVWKALTAVEPGAGDDPPVEFDSVLNPEYLNDRDCPAVRASGGRLLASRSLANFLVTFLLREAVMSGPSLATVDLKDPPEAPGSLLNVPLTPVWTDGPLFPDGPVVGGRGYDFYAVDLAAGGGAALVMRHPDEGVWVGRHGGAAADLIKPGVKHIEIT